MRIKYVTCCYPECKEDYILVEGNCICRNFSNYERTGCIDAIP